MRKCLITSQILLLAVMTFQATSPLGAASSTYRPEATAEVVQDSLVSIVRYISVDPVSQQYRTRFCFREAELYEVAGYLAEKLEEITGSPAVLDGLDLVRDFGNGDTTFTTYNIIADADLDSGSDDVVLITAHYDATGSRTPGYFSVWETSPAPGANDNGTGVAALLEAARILCAEDLPFDLRFILFSAEELGRLGSIDYVEKCDMIPQCAERILAVINLDMLGYSGTGQGVSIMSDEYSGWLAYAIEAAAGRIEPSLDVDVIRPGPWNWDHASFWEKDNSPVSAITLAEPLEEGGGIIYPDYHTLGDTLENIDFDQVGMITDVMTGFIAETAISPPEFTMFDTDIVFYVDGIERSLKEFDVTDEVSMHVKVRNIGGIPALDESIWLTVVDETAGGSRTLFEGSSGRPGVFRSSDTVIELGEDDMIPGGHIIKASIDVVSPGDLIENNSALTVFSVKGSTGGLKGHNMRPNPVTGSFSDALFCVDLEVSANLKIEIFTLEGELVADTTEGHEYGYPLDAGYRCVRCGDLFNGEKELVSGIYLYRIRFHSLDGKKADHHGRFAVVR